MVIQEPFDFDPLQMTEKNVFTQNTFHLKIFPYLDFCLLLVLANLSFFFNVEN